MWLLQASRRASHLPIHPERLVRRQPTPDLPSRRRMWTTFHMGHYVPLSWMTLGLDYELWGMQPMGYHLTSLLLHTVNAVLVYHLARAAEARSRRPAVEHFRQALVINPNHAQASAYLARAQHMMP